MFFKPCIQTLFKRKNVRKCLFFKEIIRCLETETLIDFRFFYFEIRLYNVSHTVSNLNT